MCIHWISRLARPDDTAVISYGKKLVYNRLADAVPSVIASVYVAVSFVAVFFFNIVIPENACNADLLCKGHIILCPINSCICITIVRGTEFAYYNGDTVLRKE